ncbi:MAG: peroxiredoxin [Christensenellales bacterium]|jgi:peroxiredoxin Q/BCP
MLKTGTKAPDFLLPDQNGEIHSLKNYTGKKLLLYFYPKDNTPGCTMQAVAYSAAKEQFEKNGISIIGVNKDSVSSHKKFEERHGLTITLLADTEGATLQAYDVWKEKKLFGITAMGIVRTTYVIDENGTIVFANDKVKAPEDAKSMLKMILG